MTAKDLGKFEVGRIYFRFFQYAGNEYVTSHLLKQIDSDGMLHFVPVKASDASRGSVAYSTRTFLTYKELKTLIEDDQIPVRLIEHHEPDDFTRS